MAKQFFKKPKTKTNTARHQQYNIKTNRNQIETMLPESQPSNTANGSPSVISLAGEHETNISFFFLSTSIFAGPHHHHHNLVFAGNAIPNLRRHNHLTTINPH